MIPKIIHAVWIGCNEKPLLVEKCIESWKKFCPGYKIMVWGNEILKEINNQYVWEAIRAKKYAFASDYIRLYVLKKYGGIYLDTDVELTSSIDTFLNKTFFIGHENWCNKIDIGTGCIGSIPNHKIIIDLLKEYEYIHFLLPDGSYDMTPNPQRFRAYFTKKYRFFLENGENEIRLTKDISVYPWCFFCKKKENKINYAIHHFNASWKDQENKIVTCSPSKSKFVFCNKPKVSVIIPVYNTEKYLRQCLDSIINQTLYDIEIICVDNNSTDNSLNILKEYSKRDSRIVVISQKNNSGAGHARNVAMNIAKGEYIAFVDSDDYIKPEMYKDMYEYAKKLNSDIVISDAIIHREDSDEIYRYVYKTNLSLKTESINFPYNKNVHKDLLYKTLLVSACHSWNRLYKRSFLKQKHVYFSNILCFEDCMFILVSHIQAKKISFIQEAYYYYRQHSYSTLCQAKGSENDLLKTIKQIDTYLKKKKLKKIFSINFRYFCISNAIFLYNKTDSEKVKQYLQKHIKQYLSEEDYKYFIINANQIDMKKNAKVSIIIPVYNVEKYICRCLDSVINQTYKSIEIICVNDGSLDNSRNILEEYKNRDNRVKIIDKKNGGLSSARNSGLNSATGVYCYFLDSDDWITPDAIEILVSKMNGYDVDCIVHRAQNIPEDEQCITVAQNTQAWLDSKNKKEGVYSVPLNVSDEIPAVAWNKLYKLSIIKKFHCYFPDGLINEDEAFLWSYMLHCRYYYCINNILYYYWRRSDSIMGRRNKTSQILDYLKIQQIIWKTICDYGHIDACKQFLTKKYIRDLRDIWTETPDKYKAKQLKQVFSYYKTCNHCVEIKQICDEYTEELFQMMVQYIKKAIRTFFGLNKIPNILFTKKVKDIQLYYSNLHSQEKKVTLGIIDSPKVNFIHQKKPKVSIIIPVYNTEKYIHKCLNSVINQTLHDIEIILIDDGGIDLCPKICDEYALNDSRIKVVHTSNQGASTARNIGISISKSDYVIFIDSDDYISKQYVEILYNNITSQHSDFAFCDSTVVSSYKTEECTYMSVLKNNTIISLQNRLKLLYLPHFVSPWGKIFKRKQLFKGMLFPERTKDYNGFGEDFLFILRLLVKAKKITYTTGGMYFYNRKNELSMCAVNQDRNDLDRIIIINKVFKYLKDKSIPTKYKNIVFKYSVNFLGWAQLDVIKKFYKQMDDRYTFLQKVYVRYFYFVKLLKITN